MDQLRRAIAEFLSAKTFQQTFPDRAYSLATVANLLKLLEENYHALDWEEDEMAEAVKSAVMAYKSSKKSALAILRKFLEFLGKAYGFFSQVAFPPVDSSSSFERQMYLAKTLQESEATVKDLSEELWISERTLEEDLARLRGMTEDPIQICGKPFVVPETTRVDGRFRFASTVHPFFLTFNLTQVLTLLKGLKHMAEDPALTAYAEGSAAALWEQLTPYGKNRILHVTEHLLAEDSSWYRSLEELSGALFQTERDYSRREGAGVLMDCIKNEKACLVEYLEEDDTVAFYTQCRFIPQSYRGETVEVFSDQGRKTLNLKRILRSAYFAEELL